MENKGKKPSETLSEDDTKPKDEYKGNLYPENEDIYHQMKRDKWVDVEKIVQKKNYVDDGNEKGQPPKKLSDDLVDPDLDVPGGELDNALEVIGEEDEENNYFSLGGDNHEDLEEDRS